MAEDHAYGLPTYTHPTEQKDKEIFASWSPPPRIVGITVASGQGVLDSGTIMALFDKSDSGVPAASRGKYGKFITSAQTATVGLDKPIGVLRSMVDATKEDRAGELVVFGVLKRDQIVSKTGGTIANAKSKSNADNPFRYAVEDSNRNELRIG